MRWWSRAPIRVRLTVWYTTVLASLLIVYATVTFVAVRHEFGEQLAEESRNDPEHAAFTPEDWVEHQVAEVLIVLVSGLPIVIGLAGVAGYLLARRALAPIDHLAADARQITADRLHERLAVPNQHDEIGRLAAVFNDTLARIETSFEQLRRFTADASHELRTPLSVIRGIGELGLRDKRGATEYQDAIGSMLEEVDRLTRLVDTLLRLSRGDAGTVKLTPELISLADLARDVSSSLQGTSRRAWSEDSPRSECGAVCPGRPSRSARGHDEHCRQRHQVQSREVDDHDHGRCCRFAGAACSQGRRAWNSHRPSRPNLRSLLPHRRRPIAGDGRHGPRSRNREVGRRSQRRAAHLGGRRRWIGLHRHLAVEHIPIGAVTCVI